jgi:hypothetical protein
LPISAKKSAGGWPETSMPSSAQPPFMSRKKGLRQWIWVVYNTAITETTSTGDFMRGKCHWSICFLALRYFRKSNSRGRKM